MTTTTTTTAVHASEQTGVVWLDLQTLAAAEGNIRADIGQIAELAGLDQGVRALGAAGGDPRLGRLSHDRREAEGGSGSRGGRQPGAVLGAARPGRGDQ